MAKQPIQLNDTLVALLDVEEKPTSVSRNYKPKKADTTLDDMIMELNRKEEASRVKPKKKGFWGKLFKKGGD